MANALDRTEIVGMMRSSSARLMVGIAGLIWSAAVAAPAEARLPTREEAERWDVGTALTLGGQVLKVGVLAIDYGITDRINVGTDPPMYLVRTAEPVLVPNLHLKVIAYRWDRLWLTGQASVYYANVQKGDASGTLWTVPLTAYASYQIDSRWWIHNEVTYNIVWASGDGDLTKTTVGGAAATRAVQLAVTGEYRIRPTIAITLRGRIQVYTARLAVSGSANPDDFTSIAVDARVNPRDPPAWQVVPAVAFLWQRVRLSAGVGYGNYFIPGMLIPLTKRSYVPEGSFSVVF
jgi:hypothetical protein